MKRSLAALLFAFAAGCVSPEAAGPFEFEEGEDWGEPLLEDTKADAVCATKTNSLKAIGGQILTPTGSKVGYVIIENQKIVGYQRYKSRLPAGTQVIETGGIVSPGFVDLHNHVAYNFIPLWNSGKKWNNRYQWARAKAYDEAVKKPYNLVKNAGHQCEELKYGEFRGLVGGTTSIQGSVELSCARGWTRNVEFQNFCADNVRQNVLAISSISPEEAAKLNTQFTTGATKAFLVHLAEGIDDSSRAEFEQLRALDLLKPQVVGIHSTGLTDTQIAEMGRIGMKIVWSPLSNMILYGKTTNIPAALKAGVKVALAPDWSPSGSANILGELKVADRINKAQFGGVLTDRQLWQMATQNAADIVGMGDKIGRLQTGYYADIVVIAGDRTNPYRAIIDAKPEDVLLTVIGGEAQFGAISHLEAFGKKDFELVDACGVQRGLVTKDPSVQKGDQTLTQVKQTFVNDQVTNIIPLFQCEAAPEWAF